MQLFYDYDNQLEDELRAIQYKTKAFTEPSLVVEDDEYPLTLLNSELVREET
jgi:hypothetical protein